MNDLRRILKYFRPDTARIVLVFFLMLGSAALSALKPWPLAVIIDSVLGDKPMPRVFLQTGTLNKSWLLAFLAFAIFMLYFMQSALASVQNYFSIQVSLRGLTRVRGEFFSRLLRFSARFHQSATAGDLIYRASWDTYSIQTIFQQGLMTFATALLSLAVMVVIMVRMNLTLTLVALALAPLLVVSVRMFANDMRRRTATAHQADSRVTSLVQQNIASLALTQSCAQEQFESDRFNTTVKQAQSTRLAQHTTELAYGFIIAAIFGFGAAATTWLGAKQVSMGLLTIGQLFVFLSYLAQLYEPLNQLSHVGATVAGALAGARRIFEILDNTDEIKELPETVPVPASSLKSPGQPAIAFRNVFFAYDTAHDVLRDVTFSLNCGEAMAIIGPSGAGKTTLLHLIPRFFDPKAGQIELGGVDLRRLKLKELRSSVSLVLQEPIILPATVAENIAYGKPGATAEEIESAARSANADGFIQKLGQKYQTPIGEGAARLSAGERQRINLARAFLKDAPILVLDEPTSALDAESEALIAQSLETLVKGRATLIVAHRLETIARVQLVLALEDGRVSEIGSPAKLLARGGYYARVMRA
jgi:ATP-binding cassette subfamily B protein/subfamily B ATP-binding cassette protein MsbA